MLLALLFVQKRANSSAILNDAWKRISGADSMTVTCTRTTEEFDRRSVVSYSIRKGGYFRAIAGKLVDIANPQHGWTFDSGKKIYQVRPPIGAGFSPARLPGIEFCHSGMPTIGGPMSVVWHKRSALRIELDGRTMTKETKLFVFVDPKTHLPIGVSANLGSTTQVVLIDNLKLNPKLDDAVFNFTPPAGWKLVTAKTGGWR